MDWRLLDQDEYLMNKEFIKVDVISYKNKILKQGLFHEHCEFCFDKIENIDQVFCTKDFYNWVCPICFNDFKEKFKFNEFKYKYFVLNNEREGTFYHEFAFGKCKNVYWNEKSIYIDDFEMQKIYKIFEDNVDKYDYFGSTIVDEKSWNKIIENLDNYSFEIKEAVYEIQEWVEYSLERYKCFTIIGI